MVVRMNRSDAIIRQRPLTTYLTDVELLCVECQRPIKGRINTEQWVRVEFIGPNGECRECCQAKPEQGRMVDANRNL